MVSLGRVIENTPANTRNPRRVIFSAVFRGAGISAGMRDTYTRKIQRELRPVGAMNSLRVI